MRAGRCGPLWAEASRTIAKAIGDSVPQGVAAFFRGDGVTEGFAAPPTGRYLICTGPFAEAGIADKRYGGNPGTPVASLYASRLIPWRDHPLWLLSLLSGIISADPEGEEVVQGTWCRKYRTRLASPPVAPLTEELTAWLDGEHVRQVRAVEERRDKTEILGTVTDGRRSWTTYTLELRDFGVSLDELDWSRLPSFRVAGSSQDPGRHNAATA